MILVSGGTGMVGSAIVAELLRRGEPVAVLGRDKAKVQQAFAGTVEAREADVTKPATLTAAFEGIDVVVNAVQFPTSPIEVPRKGWTFEEVDYRGAFGDSNWLDGWSYLSKKGYLGSVTTDVTGTLDFTLSTMNLSR